MQKLLELLNQYDDEEGKDLYEWEIEWEDIIWYNRFWGWYETIDVSKSAIISKRYWFIERLVKKDKIDFEHMSWHWRIISYLTDEKNYKRNDIKEWVVLMLLSIQEEPINFLISLLK